MGVLIEIDCSQVTEPEQVLGQGEAGRTKKTNILTAIIVNLSKILKW